MPGTSIAEKLRQLRKLNSTTSPTPLVKIMVSLLSDHFTNIYHKELRMEGYEEKARFLLLHKETADLLTPDVLIYIFCHEEGKLNTFFSKCFNPQKLTHFIEAGFCRGEDGLRTLCNKRDDTAESLNVEFDANTSRICAAVDVALARLRPVPVRVEEPITVPQALHYDPTDGSDRVPSGYGDNRSLLLALRRQDTEQTVPLSNPSRDR